MYPPKLTSPTTFNDFLNESFHNLCTFPPTNTDEIRQIIASLKFKTTSKSYDTPAKFLKISANSLSSWLSKFFNKSMTIGDFPNLSNIAQIAPIPKKLLPNLLTIMDQYPYFQHSPKFLKN